MYNCAEHLCKSRVRAGFYRCDFHTHALLDRLAAIQRKPRQPPQQPVDWSRVAERAAQLRRAS